MRSTSTNDWICSNLYIEADQYKPIQVFAVTMHSTSSSRSTTPSKGNKKRSSMSVAADDFRYDILEPNNILIADGRMNEEKWSDLAFSLGLPARSGQRSTATTCKFAQKMSKRKTFTASQTYEYIKPLIESLVTDYPELSQRNNCIYHGDAVPTVDSLKNTVHRLPTPKPAISIGYYRNAFSLAHDELQSGIIAGPYGEPYDLNRISQPVTDHFWPFFVVEISDQSLSAARQAAAVSGATCNNALNLLAGAAAHDYNDWKVASSSIDSKFAKAFSLSLHGKVATLSTHGAEGSAPHVSTQIEAYKLDNESDVASLADRIHGIMIWATHNRLRNIATTLDQLDRKVHGSLSGLTLRGDESEFDLDDLKVLKLHLPRRPDRMKVGIRAGLSAWLSRS